MNSAVAASATAYFSGNDERNSRLRAPGSTHGVLRNRRNRAHPRAGTTTASTAKRNAPATVAMIEYRRSRPGLDGGALSARASAAGRRVDVQPHLLHGPVGTTGHVLAGR